MNRREFVGSARRSTFWTGWRKRGCHKSCAPNGEKNGVRKILNARYVTYLYRTADFRHWDCGRYNSLVSCSQDDRRLSPCAVEITPVLAEQGRTHFIGSASDFEMCDFGGQTYINYIIGDQQGFYYMCEAWYDGPMGELLENCFK